MGQLLALPRCDYPQNETSTTANSKASNQAEACQDEVANEVQGLAADLDHRWVQMSQVETDLVAEQVAHEAERRTARLDESERSARHGQALNEEAIDATWVEVARGAAEGVRKTADSLHREAEVNKVLGEEMARIITEEARKAIGAREKWRLMEGIQPAVTPSPEEFAAAKRRIQYKEGCFHVAVAGISGSGKSSLINAFRGLRRRDTCAAPVGVTERALQVARYSDANPENPFVWCEIPGAGAVKHHDWQYFNDQGLYVFDSIIILFDNRFTLTDIAILANTKRFNIPTYVVRSKADRYVQNIMLDMGYDSDDNNEDVERRNKLYDAARKQFVEETRKCVQASLENADLLNQRVYIVSSSTLLSIVRNKMPKKVIDEVELLQDLFNQVNTRRVALSDEMISSRIGSWSRG